jgi:hypothetical protein
VSGESPYRSGGAAFSIADAEDSINCLALQRSKVLGLELLVLWLELLMLWLVASSSGSVVVLLAG